MILVMFFSRVILRKRGALEVKGAQLQEPRAQSMNDSEADERLLLPPVQMSVVAE